MPADRPTSKRDMTSARMRGRQEAGMPQVAAILPEGSVAVAGASSAPPTSTSTSSDSSTPSWLPWALGGLAVAAALGLGAAISRR